MAWNLFYFRLSILAAVILLIVTNASSQQISSYDRDRALAMWDAVAKDIQKRYYDPQLHQLDWASTIRDTQQKIKSSASLNMALAHIAQASITLDDSHTFFLPPPRPYFHEYGYRAIMVGDVCFITNVKPGSDAEAKGLKAGDELLVIDNFPPRRNNLWKMEYRYNILRPQPGMNLALRNPQGETRQIQIGAKFKELQLVKDVTANGVWDLVRDAQNEAHAKRAQYLEVGDDITVLRLPEFRFEPAEIDAMISRARKRPALILDLRDNPGGSVDSLKDLLGGMFDHDVKVADRKGRKESKPETAKSLNHGAYAGKLVVLINSKSASAAELFARVIQLEKRGTVIGDRSAGAVMESKRYQYALGMDTKVFYGASISEWDLIMTDGNSLEHRGVTPDELVLPTADDLASGRDPVLSRAVAVLGGRLSPQAAGKLFPYEWPKEPTR